MVEYKDKMKLNLFNLNTPTSFDDFNNKKNDTQEEAKTTRNSKNPILNTYILPTRQLLQQETKQNKRATFSPKQVTFKAPSTLNSFNNYSIQQQNYSSINIRSPKKEKNYSALSSSNSKNNNSNDINGGNPYSVFNKNATLKTNLDIITPHTQLSPNKKEIFNIDNTDSKRDVKSPNLNNNKKNSLNYHNNNLHNKSYNNINSTKSSNNYSSFLDFNDFNDKIKKEKEDTQDWFQEYLNSTKHTSNYISNFQPKIKDDKTEPLLSPTTTTSLLLSKRKEANDFESKLNNYKQTKFYKKLENLKNENNGYNMTLTSSSNLQMNNFDFNSYFLEASLNKKSLLNSSILKNYNEEQRQKEFIEKLNKKNMLTDMLIAHKKNDNENFFKNSNIEKLPSHDIKGKYNNSNNNSNLNNLDDDSFDNFAYGFSTKSTQNPSFSISCRYLKEKLKYGK